MDTQTREAPSAQPDNPTPVDAAPVVARRPFYRNKLVLFGSIAVIVVLLLGAFVAGLAVGSAVASGHNHSRTFGPGGHGDVPPNRNGNTDRNRPPQGGNGTNPRNGNQNGNQNGTNNGQSQNNG